MNDKTLHLSLGLGALVGACFLVFYAIPNWVASPSNVQYVILSPLFWPYALSAFTGLVGLGLVATSLRNSDTAPPEDYVPSIDSKAAMIRMGGIAGIMVGSMALMPLLGMVWTSMLAFMATAFLVRTRHPKAAVICAIVVPLILYAFFAHVAGVAIPQGIFVRLP